MVVTKESRMQGKGIGGMSHRTAAWLAWSLWTGCVALLGLALFLDFLTGEVLPPGPLGERPGPTLALLTGVLSLASPTVGALIASRLPANPIGWRFCGIGLLYTAQRFSIAYADYALLENFAFHPGAEYVAWFSSLIDFKWLLLAGVFVMLLFPNGHLLSRRWRIVAWMAVCGALLTALYDAFYPGENVDTHSYVRNPFGVVGVIGGRITTFEFFEAANFVGFPLLMASILGALFSLFVRLHRAWGDERQQIKWFLYAAVPAGVGFSLSLISYFIYKFTDLEFINPFDPGGVFSWIVHDLTAIVYYNDYYAFGEIDTAINYAIGFTLLLVPLFTYIAIVRYHLYDIDVVINRTLVYGALSACVVGIYVLAVVALGALFQARGNFAISLLATALVAVLFQPLRSRLQRGVNRLMYGERDDPYAVISRLGRSLEATLAPESVLPTLVETIAQALKLPYAAILLKEGEGFRTAAAYGSPRGEPETLPLVYQREE